MPRFRIAWGMVAVAIAAVEFAALRSCVTSPAAAVPVLGSLPIANLVMAAILIGRRHPEKRPFLLGFEAFGAIAVVITMAFGVAVSSNEQNRLLQWYLQPVAEPIITSVGRDSAAAFIPILMVVFMIMLGWPHVVFALMGGWLSRRYKVIITRR